MKNKDTVLLENAYAKLNEAKGYSPVNSKYVYFPDDRMVYLQGKKALKGETIDTLIKKDSTINGWKKVFLAIGEDINDLVSGSSVDSGAWYIVDDSFPGDHKFLALTSF
jgi:hypothetical protein